MKRLRIDRWGAQSLSRAARPRPRTACPFQQSAIQQQNQPARIRLQSTSTVPHSQPPSAIETEKEDTTAAPTRNPLESLPSPRVSAALHSAKLAALHARISLPTRVPLPTFARTLVDPSADQNYDFNNMSLSTLGQDLLGYYTAEHLLCQYPRLPMTVLFAAQAAFVGPAALAAVRREWGVDAVAEPGGEVDPGLLQFKRTEPGALQKKGVTEKIKTKGHWDNWRVGTPKKIANDDQFGDWQWQKVHGVQARREAAERDNTVTLEEASARFVRAVVGAVYLHAGRQVAYQFITSHFLRRHLDLSKLFDFREPTRDLSRLCAREGFDSPVARLLSETGRHSRTPVFVVGVFSGEDKLGESYGASLDEARFRAAAAALKSWYLYSPVDITKPSEFEAVGKTKYIPNMIDLGEVIV